MLSSVDARRIGLADLSRLRDEAPTQGKPHILACLDVLIAELEAETAGQSKPPHGR